MAQRSTSLPPSMMLAETEVLLVAASSVEVSRNCKTTSGCTSLRNLPQLSAFPREHAEQCSYTTLVKTALLSGLLAQAHPCTGQVVGTGSAGCTALPEGTGPAVASGHCSVPGRRWVSGRVHGSCTHESVNVLKWQHKAGTAYPRPAVGPGIELNFWQPASLPVHAAWDEAEWSCEQSEPDDPDEASWRQGIALQQTSLTHRSCCC